MRIVATGAGYRFEATFRNKVRDPATVRGAAGPEPLDYFARHGFYAFNLDIYLDLDRVRGSGNAWSLPGRGVRIDDAHAWDKAVILTPRPELMRRQLIDALAHDDPAGGEAGAARRVDGLVRFATDVRVRGRTVSFDVPRAFLDAGRPDTDWSVTALVTAAKIAIDADLDLVQSETPVLDRLPLGAMQPRPGRPRDTVGYAGPAAPAAVVDWLAADPAAQKALLAATLPLPGMTWSAAGAAGAPGSAVPVASLRPAIPAVPAAAPAPSEPSRGDVAARLRRLDALRQEGLLSDAEYQEQRRRILGEL